MNFNFDRGQNQGSKKATLQSYKGMSQQKRMGTPTFENAYETNTNKTLRFYCNISDFLKNVVEIPTTPRSEDVVSNFLAGKAPLYNLDDDKLVGSVGANTLSIGNILETNPINIDCMITNYLYTFEGLRVEWPTYSSVIKTAESTNEIIQLFQNCYGIVPCNLKLGNNPWYGTTFQLSVLIDTTQVKFILNPLSKRNF